MDALSISPTMTALAMALRLEHQDAAFHRALDKATDQLVQGTVYEFDGDELRVLSASRRGAGVIHVANTKACTCEGARHPWCWHRALVRLLFVHEAVKSPCRLRSAVLAQADPDISPAEEIDFSNDPIAPGAVKAAGMNARCTTRVGERVLCPDCMRFDGTAVCVELTTERCVRCPENW